MEPIDTAALVGEVLSWIGLGVGIPVLLLAGMVRLAEGRWEKVEIAIVERDGRMLGRWFHRGDFHERMLRDGEARHVDGDWHTGFVRARDVSHMRVQPPALLRALVTIGAVFAGIGVVGFVVSLLPAFV